MFFSHQQANTCNRDSATKLRDKCVSAYDTCVLTHDVSQSAKMRSPRALCHTDNVECLSIFGRVWFDHFAVLNQINGGAGRGTRLQTGLLMQN